MFLPSFEEIFYKNKVLCHVAQPEKKHLIYLRNLCALKLRYF